MRSYTLSQYAPVLMLLLGLGLAPAAAAQSALIDTPVFQVNADGALVSRGAVGVGTIPATGAGTRLMWYPAKAAFRAGRVQGGFWNEALVGDYSVALGLNTRASGPSATALGNFTVASGLNAVAMGSTTTASGQNATAMGSGTAASGEGSTAMGENTAASGQNATAMGLNTTASGNYAMAMGWNTQASRLGSTAMGDGTEASGLFATAMGQSTTASGLSSTAMGQGTTASGEYATAMGSTTTASGLYATAMSWRTTASGPGSTAMGFETTASGKYATAMGRSATAQAFASLTLGRYNVIVGDPDTWISSDPVLVVGNGTSTNHSNAMTLFKNGNLSIAGTLSQNSDRRLKTEIRPLSEVTSSLARLQPVRYRFRAGTNRPEGVHLGLIAQEVQAVFPELVHEGADGYLSVSYTNLTAVLVQALNEQQDQIDALRAEMASLRSAIETRPTPGASPEH